MVAIRMFFLALLVFLIVVKRGYATLAALGTGFLDGKKIKKP